MNGNLRGFLLYQLPPWVWGLGIFIGTSLPEKYLPKFVLFGPDKLLHILAFFVLSILVYRAVAHRKDSKLGKTLVTTTVLVTIGFGIFDELHQYLIPGRFPDVFDVIADGVGMGFGLATMRVYQRVAGKRAGEERNRKDRQRTS